MVEIMVVVVIIGLLAGAVSLGVKAYVDKSRVNRAKSDISTIMAALEAYYAEHSAYPSNDRGLEVLNLKNAKDPWGKPYEYETPGRNGPYTVSCFGADGREGGAGIDADITSDDLETKKDK